MKANFAIPFLLLGAAFLFLPPSVAQTPPAAVEIGAEARTELSLTVYNTDLALVHESRRARLPDGSVSLRLAGIPEGIEARSVDARFRGPGSVQVLEQNLLADLIAPQRILELSVGRPVTLVFDDDDGEERRVRATLLSTNGGLVFSVGDEVVLNPPARVVVDELPVGLLPRPFLEWQLQVRRAGDRDIDARYLTHGFSWSADYVATLDDEAGLLELAAWVTVDNLTDAGFEDARLQLVAGDVHRIPPTARRRFAPQEDGMVALEAMAAEPAPGFREQSFGEYHLYALERPASLAPRSSKQLVLHDAGEVPFRRQYVVTSGPRYILGRGLSGEPQKRPVEVRVEFDNTQEAGLGRPLPAGTLRLYAPAGAGELLFRGEDRVEHTAEGETISLVSGRSFDLVAERLQTDYQDRRRGFEAAFEIRLRNRKDEEVAIQVREVVPGDWTVVESSHPFTKRDASTIQFDVEVSAGGEAVLTYRVRVSY
jgi:hypothetical protein